MSNNERSFRGCTSSSLRGRGGGFGPAPCAIPQVVGMYDMCDDATMDTRSNKLYVSNLNYGVSNEDIKEIFSEVGEIKRYSVNYDRSGRSKGTAEVVFERRSDALAAVRRYNNVQLDGMPMKIEIVEASIAPPVFPPVNTAIFVNPAGFSQRGLGRAVGRGSTGNARHISQRGGRGRGRDSGEKVFQMI